MKLRSAAILLLTSLCFATAGAQSKQVNTLRKQKQQAQKEITATANKLKANDEKTLRTMRNLNSITAEINEQAREIDVMQKDLDNINLQLQQVNDSLAAGEARLERVKTEFGQAVKKMHVKTTATDRVIFVLSAKSVREGFRRVRYMREYSEWRVKQVKKINELQERLKATQSHINKLVTEKNSNIQQQSLKKLSLEKKQAEEKKLVKTLKSERGRLKTILDKKQREARELDRAIDRMIEQERRAAEEAERKRLAEEERQRKEAEAAAAAKAAKEAQAKAASEKKSEKKAEKSESAKSSAKSSATSTPKKSATETPKVTPPKSTATRLGNTFESNKGRLPYPVTGNFKIVRHFGVQQHPQLPYVKTDNGGIDIETSRGAVARAIFEGKVSAVFKHDGFNNVVMIRHGNYLTIYVNLKELYVHTGETVKANQRIGRIYSDDSDDGRTTLHFEIRKETVKLNPELWLRR